VFIIRHNLRAQKDLLQAAEWYEDQQKGLGEKFIDEYENLDITSALTPNYFRKNTKECIKLP
jgi:hypothetical protein